MPQETRQQHEEQMDKIRERILHGELSVSGGKDNPPDRYIMVALSPSADDNLAAINRYADQDYRIAGTIPGYVLMGNYKENK